MEKLVLCLELRTWERAEEFADKVKKLVESAGMDYVREAFKLEMAVRKADYDKSMEQYQSMKNMLDHSGEKT